MRMTRLRLLITASALTVLLAQNVPPAGNTGPDDKPEMVSLDTPVTFKTGVDLVLVPVVVRDASGRAVGNLTRDDFQLFDEGKPQVITRFASEKADDGAPASRGESDRNALEAIAGAKIQTAAPPADYVALLFDDIHLHFNDLAHARMAAERRFAEPPRESELLAVYTTSGRTTADFTDDRTALRNALVRIQPVRPPARSECPYVSYYMAHLIQNLHDKEASDTAIKDAVACLNGSVSGGESTSIGGGMARAYEKKAMMEVAAKQVDQAAGRALAAGESDTRLAVRALSDVVRRLAVLPGRRTIILVSPGFLSLNAMSDKSSVIDQAIRSNVVISAMDARGLYTAGSERDISQPKYDLASPGAQSRYEGMTEFLQTDVLAEVPAGTGGTFFHDNNDLDRGFKELASRPEYVYVLGFSPQSLKPDGSVHSLKVTLPNAKGLNVQARRAYMAPEPVTDPAEAVKRELQRALFAREEIDGLPVELQTQFFKASAGSAKLSVIARIDLARMHFQKVDGRNRNDLTVVSGLFDHNGLYISATQKQIDMNLKDETARRRIAVKLAFDVKPGTYHVRLVVRDSQGQLLSAKNGSVEIP